MNLHVFTSEVILFFLVFSRAGMVFMLLPAFGSSYVSARIRLFLAVTVSLIFATILPPEQNLPDTGSALSILVAVSNEVLIGFFMGALAKIISSALHIAGMLISMQSSLSQAMLFDPSQGAQGAIFGNFLDIMALALMFALNLHHLLIAAIAGSYEVYPLGHLPDMGQLLDSVVTTMNSSFKVGFQLAAPVVIIGLLVNLASGLLSRLMPSFQVFFVILPLQITLAIFIFTTTLSVMLMWYMGYLESSFTEFL